MKKSIKWILLFFVACNVGDEGGFAPNILSNKEGKHCQQLYYHSLIYVSTIILSFLYIINVSVNNYIITIPLYS